MILLLFLAYFNNLDHVSAGVVATAVVREDDLILSARFPRWVSLAQVR